MGTTLLPKSGGGWINIDHIETITQDNVAVFIDGSSSVLDAGWARSDAQLHIGATYSYEDEFGWLSSGLSQVAEAISNATKLVGAK